MKLKTPSPRSTIGLKLEKIEKIEKIEKMEKMEKVEKVEKIEKDGENDKMEVGEGVIEEGNEEENGNIESNVQLGVSTGIICSSPQTQMGSGSGSNVKYSENEILNTHIDATVLQMVEVLSCSESPEWAVLLIRETLHGKNDDTNGIQILNKKQINKKREESIIYCEKLMEGLIEILLKSEENNENLMEKIKGKRDMKEQIVAVIKTISIFCEAHPPFALKHLTVLLPYLKVRTKFDVILFLLLL